MGLRQYSHCGECKFLYPPAAGGGCLFGCETFFTHFIHLEIQVPRDPQRCMHIRLVSGQSVRGDAKCQNLETL